MSTPRTRTIRTGQTAPGPLDALRGPNPAPPLNARGITAMLETPSCVRRAVFEETVGLDRLAPFLDVPPGEQAQHAFMRGNTFEDLVMANGASELLAILREKLGLPLDKVAELDLSAEAVTAKHGRVADINQLRVKLTRHALRAMLSGADGAATILRHGMTTLTVGHRTAYLEHDALALVVDGRLHVVEIKSFPHLDGRADPGKADAAARQSAVYVLSAREALVALGFDPDLVSTTGVLVLPKNFGLTPVGHLVDLATRVRRMQAQLETRPSDADLAALIPAGMTLPALPKVTKTAHPAKRAAQDEAVAAVAPAVQAAFDSLPPRFGDGCVSCPAFVRCRDEVARTGGVASLGTNAVNACGSVTAVRTALDLADGTRAAGTGAEAALADSLARARAARARPA
jgi:hypothetical protein